MSIQRAVSADLATWRSANTPDNPFLRLDELDPWLARERGAGFKVHPVPFAEMDKWGIDRDWWRIAHESGSFFTVEGRRIASSFPSERQWEQPLVVQPEIGMLGLVTRVIDGVRYFLLQAKMEPGNLNMVQLAPTVQATKSNHTRVHRGLATQYIEFFLGSDRATVFIDQLQCEQNSRFLGKRNRNMIVEVQHEIEVLPGFNWFTLRQIRYLLKRADLVNMDVRSILSCLPLVPQEFEDQAHLSPVEGFAYRLVHSAVRRERGVHSIEQLLMWLTTLKADCLYSIEPVQLNKMVGWLAGDREIRTESGRPFSVMAVEVEAPGREVDHWAQPLLGHHHVGLNGFLAQQQQGVLHLLVRASFDPGNIDILELNSTIYVDDAASLLEPGAPPFADLFAKPPAGSLRFDVVHSEEGGRFYRYRLRYVVLELESTEKLRLPREYRWVTVGQLEILRTFGFVGIEARNLLSCLDVAEEP